MSDKFRMFDILDVDMGGELSADELVTGLMQRLRVDFRPLSLSNGLFRGCVEMSRRATSWPLC